VYGYLRLNKEIWLVIGQTEIQKKYASALCSGVGTTLIHFRESGAMSAKRQQTLPTNYFQREIRNALDETAAGMQAQPNSSGVGTRHMFMRQLFEYWQAGSASGEKTARSSDEFYALFALLNERQLLALLHAREGQNLFLTGSAGTGKTLWMRVAVAMLQSRGKQVEVCATTALAASNIKVLPVNKLPPPPEPTAAEAYHAKKRAKKAKPRRMFDISPRTLHSFAGIGISDFEPAVLGAKMLNEKRLIKTRNRWRYTQTLFVDEVSMLAPKLFVKLDSLAQVVRQNNRPFGGMQLIFVGDFCQLPPVVKFDRTTNDRMAANGNSNAFEDDNDDFVHAADLDNDGNSSDSSSDDDPEMTEYLQERRRAQRLEAQRLAQEAAEEERLRNLLRPKEDPEDARYCFETTSWHDTVQSAIVLNTVFRQQNPVFVDLLCELRHGTLSHANIELLETRTRQRLRNDLLDIAHNLFGGRGCERLECFAQDVYDRARAGNTIDPVNAHPDIDLTECFVDKLHSVADETSPRAKVIPNWERLEKYAIKCATSGTFDVTNALPYLLPPECVPASHEIIVSPIEPTAIMSLNSQVEQCNRAGLAGIRGEAKTFPAAVSIGLSHTHRSFQEAQTYFADQFGRSGGTPLQLLLKVGAQVMLTANVCPPQHINGRKGVVLAYLNSADFAEQYADHDEAVQLGTAQTDASSKLPVVLFENNVVARVGKHSWERHRVFFGVAKPVCAVMQQIPLMLAFAITIHRAQGQTISRLSVNMSNAFESGLPYVAISRAVGLESLVIESLDKRIFDGSQKHLLPREQVEAYYAKLEEKTDRVMKEQTNNY